MGIQPKKGKQRFSDNFYNSITYGGVVLSVLVLVCEIFLFAIDIIVVLLSFFDHFHLLICYYYYYSQDSFLLFQLLILPSQYHQSYLHLLFSLLSKLIIIFSSPQEDIEPLDTYQRGMSREREKTVQIKEITIQYDQ